MKTNDQDKLRANVTVLIADGEPDLQNDRFDVEYVKIPLNPVPVRLDGPDYAMAAIAILRKEGNLILADMEFFRDPSLYDHLYPSVAGKVLERMSNGYNGASITRIDLSCKNADLRIPRLGNNIKRR